jgi:transposase-like protein
MEARMKNYADTERNQHVENWKNGTMSRAAYAKSAGIIPTTFYTWIRQAENREQNFVEIGRRIIPGSVQDMAIEKDGIVIRLPVSTGANELKTILEALGIKS